MSKLLEISAFDGVGYLPLVDYGEWRVAMLRFEPNLAADMIRTMQRHEETDEVFVLLEGRCILFVSADADDADAIEAADLEPLKLYNVKRGVWHTHTLSADASVLIIENRDTTLANSPLTDLSEAQRAQIVQLTAHLWEPA